jgi:hypothetical protein
MRGGEGNGAPHRRVEVVDDRHGLLRGAEHSRSDAKGA